MFNNSIFDDYNCLRKQAEELKIHQTNYNNDGQPTKYKKCPYCGEIWFKIRGSNCCICGKRSRLEDKIWGTFRKYIVKYSNKSITYQIIEVNNNYLKRDEKPFLGLSEEEKKRNIVLKSQGRKEIIPIGCGKKFIWVEAEDVTDYVNNFLKSIPSTDYDSKILNIIDDMKKSKI